jgi:hypothetical protein
MIPSILSFLPWLGILIYLSIKSSKLRWFLVLFSPWTIIPLYSFGAGTKDYFQGEATIMSVGLPAAEFWNLDRELRVWNSTSGCIETGNEIFTRTPNNIAVRFWTKLLGIQVHAYRGFYPRESYAFAELNKDTSPIKFQGNSHSVEFKLNGKSCQLTTDSNSVFSFRDTTGLAKIIVLKNECIVFQAVGDSTKQQTLLADKNTGKVFAQYFNYETR